MGILGLEHYSVSVVAHLLACGNAAAEAALERLAEQARHQRALGLLEQARDLWAATGDAHRQAYTLASLGHILATLDRTAEAVAALEEALSTARSRADASLQAVVLNTLGCAFERTNPETAIGYYSQCLEAAEFLHSQVLELATQANIGQM